MITETQTCLIVLQLDDELLAQLQPFLVGLDITIAAQRLSMRAEIYEALAERVGDALDYEVRWQPDECEPEGFVERVRPLELSHGILTTVSCTRCRTQLLANCAEVACACRQGMSLR